MKEEYKNLELIKNSARHRFEMTVAGQIAYISYKEIPGRMTLIHTIVPPELEGQGVATAIIEKALDYLKTNQLKLIPMCPFVAAYIKRHPEWNKIVVEEKEEY